MIASNSRTCNWAARLLLFAALLIFASLPKPAFAQTAGTGVLTGTVIDAAEKKPIADAIVTATSPDLQGEQVVVTDSSGFFRIPDLPTGVYSLRFEKDAFKGGSREGITLRAEATLRVNIELLPEQLKAEEVVVVARAPVVDVGSSSIGSNITQEFTRRVPVAAPDGKGGASRSFEAVAEVTPGAKQDYNGSGVSFAGSSSPENNYVVDGLSVSNPGFGIVGTPLSIEFVKETNVLTGGYMPEYGRTMGGVLNVVTKSGSNEFHGGGWVSYTPGALQATPKSVNTVGGSVVATTGLSYLGDIGADVGGPIIKDKLWFYTGVDVANTVYYADRYFTHQTLDSMGNVIVGKDGTPTTVKINGSDEHYEASAQALQVLAKLTWAINPDNKVTGTFIAAPTWSGGPGRFAIDPATGNSEGGSIATGTYQSIAHVLNNSAYDASLKWSTEFNNKSILVDTIAGYHHEEDVIIPADGSLPGHGTSAIPAVEWYNSRPITDFEHNPALGNSMMGPCVPPPGASVNTLCPSGDFYSTGGTSGVGPSTTGRNSIDSFDRFSAGSTITFLFQGLGHHIVKAGFNIEFTAFDHEKSHSGGYNLDEETNPLTGANAIQDTERFGTLVGPDNPIFNEPWRVKPTSILAGGFIQDSWSIMDVVTANVGVRYDTQTIYSADGNVGISLPNQWSPRFGFIWDPTQQGRAKIFASYARYYENMPLSIGEASLTGEGLLKASHPALTSNGVGDTPGACDITKPPYCDNNAGRTIVSNNTPSQYWLHSGFGQDPVDPNIKPTSIDDFVTGGEYEILKDARLGLNYQKRWVNAWIEDMSADGRATFFIGNPGYGMASMFPKAERDYDAVTLYFQKAFSNNWLTSASYTISYLRGNIPGLDSGGGNHGGYFDAPELAVNASGPLPSDNSHAIKLFGAKEWVINPQNYISTGAAFRATSGAPTSYFGADLLYGTLNNYLIQAGTGPRLPWTYDVDLNLGYRYAIDKDKSLAFTVDIFNLLNFQETTAVDQSYTNSTAVGKQGGTLADVRVINGSQTRPLYKDLDVNPNYGNATGYQSPRIFRFSLRGTF
jgi:hypothetical protein